MEMLPRYGLVDTARLFIKLRERNVDMSVHQQGLVNPDATKGL